MAYFFFESSALVKRYVRERGSVWVEGLFTPEAGHTIFIAAITSVELVSAISRRTGDGSVSQEDATYACALLRNDLTHSYQVVPVTEFVIFQAMTLAERHKLRGYDAVQLAAAVEIDANYRVAGLPIVTLVSADRELNAVAVNLGLRVEDPNTHL